MTATTGRPAKELIVTAADRRQLESTARSESLPAALVLCVDEKSQVLRANRSDQEP